MKAWISPSKLAYLYAECPRCTWLSYRGVKAPGGDFSEFNLLDEAQKRALPVGTDLSPMGIPGAVRSIGGNVCSVDYGVRSIEARIYGVFDVLAALHDGGFAVVDLKSGTPDVEKRERYRKQLSAYALALGEPDRGAGFDVRAAYLLHNWPTNSDLVTECTPPTIVMQWPLATVEISIDVEEVRSSVRGLVELIAREDVPSPGVACAHCRYIEKYCSTVREWKGREKRLQEVGA